VVIESGAARHAPVDGRTDAATSRRPVLEVLRVPSFPSLLVAGWLWTMCRWASGFLGAFVANRSTGSARLVQLTGVALWAPLLLGGVLGGVVSDRFDRRKTVIVQFVALIPLSAAMGIAGIVGSVRLWMLYPFLVVVGIGWVADMTSRRAMIFDVVGPDRVAGAMALESVSTSSGLAIGTLVGGAAVEALGIGAAYLCMCGLAVGALVMFLRVPRVDRLPAAAESPPVAFRSGFRLLRTERALLSVLGVTAAVNFFYFSFTPLVQLVASDLGVGAFLTSLLAAMLGVGMMTGSGVVARAQPRRRGAVYAVGSGLAMVMLVPFALSPWYPVSLAFMLLSAIGMGLFSSLQGTLVMTSVAPELRGRALGLLSTAIGVLPVGMILLGELAERIGARTAIVVSVLSGTAVLTGWLRWRPELLERTG
jgi:predicted MFS family arabinose efflux permease